MAKPATRSYSRYARDGAELLGRLVHSARVERELTVAEVAERAGVSRGLVHRIENGDMGCSIGAVFEVAAIVGLRLFEAEPTTLTRHLSLARDKLTLLPGSVRTGARKVKDDF
jgi:transcriptional regulator with XRE-family HTH domain